MVNRTTNRGSPRQVVRLSATYLAIDLYSIRHSRTISHAIHRAAIPKTIAAYSCIGRLNPNLVKYRLLSNRFETAVILPWSLQHFKTIRQLKRMIRRAAIKKNKKQNKKNQNKTIAAYSCIGRLNPNLVKYRLPITYLSVIQSNSFETAMILPRCLQHFKTIRQLKRMSWTNEISRDLSLRWVSGEYPTLHSTPWSLNVTVPNPGLPDLKIIGNTIYEVLYNVLIYVQHMIKINAHHI